MQLIDFWKIQRYQQGEACEIRPFHHLIANHLTDLILGRLENPNLMILMPPRCGKTDLGVKAFVSWAMDWFPDSEFIIGCYGNTLATDNTVAVRDTLGAEWHRSIVDDEWGAAIDMRGDKAAGQNNYFHTIKNF